MIKQITLTLFLTSLFTVGGRTQNIGMSANYNFTGKNFRVGIQYSLPKISFESGVKYHLNKSYWFDSRNLSYLDRFHAFSFIEHFGLYHTSKFNLIRDNGNDLTIYALHNIDINRIGYRSAIVEKYGYDSLGDRLYRVITVEHPPVLSIENTVGLGIRSAFQKNMALMLEAGLGVIHIWDYAHIYRDPETGLAITIGSGRTYDLPGMHLRAGLVYKLGRK